MKQKGKKLLIPVIITIIIITIVIIAISGLTSSIFEKEKQTKQKETETEVKENDIEISYKVASYENNRFKILIKISDENNGIDTVYMPDGIVRNGNGKKILGIDYEIDEGVDYIFTVRNTKGIEVKETINLIKPIEPTIPTLNLGYPILKTTGISYEIQPIEIQYDEREDFINYYSLNNGKTWELYTGPITDANVISRNILAKSVHKKYPEIYTEANKMVERPSDSLVAEVLLESDRDFYWHGSLTSVNYGKALIDEKLFECYLDIEHLARSNEGFRRISS